MNRKMRRAGALLCALLLIDGAQAGAHLRGPKPAAPAILHAGTLLAEPGQATRREVTVLVRNGRIEQVMAGYRSPAELGLPDTPVTDLSQRFVLPGLMDAHVHLMAQPSVFVNSGREGAGSLSKSDLAAYAALFAQRTLAAGFTTVRDVGSNDESLFAIRDAINRGDLPGPRILVAGPVLSATGGHADRGINASRTLNVNERRREGVCDGAAECTQAVRYLKKIGADLVKFTATGGFMSDTGTQQQYFADEMRAIVDTAHGRGLKVAAHAYDAQAVRLAVAAGVDSIEHGWGLDAEGLRAMKKRGTFLVPTLLISRNASWTRTAGTAGGGQLRDEMRAFENALAIGVNVAFGTDVGIFDHGQNAREFAVMVELGMSPAQAIRSATVQTARLFGLDDELGTLVPGMQADLIAVAGDPLADIEALYDVDFVMHRGQTVKLDGRWVAVPDTRPVGNPVKLR